jgi:hypothetical protein
MRRALRAGVGKNFACSIISIQLSSLGAQAFSQPKRLQQSLSIGARLSGVRRRSDMNGLPGRSERIGESLCRTQDARRRRVCADARNDRSSGHDAASIAQLTLVIAR